MADSKSAADKAAEDAQKEAVKAAEAQAKADEKNAEADAKRQEEADKQTEEAEKAAEKGKVDKKTGLPIGLDGENVVSNTNPDPATVRGTYTL